jgi:hypothetical protein
MTGCQFRRFAPVGASTESAYAQARDPRGVPRMRRRRPTTPTTETTTPRPEAGALSRTRSSGVWFFVQLHSSIFPESVRVLRSRWPSDA